MTLNFQPQGSAKLFDLGASPSPERQSRAAPSSQTSFAETLAHQMQPQQSSPPHTSSQSAANSTAKPANLAALAKRQQSAHETAHHAAQQAAQKTAQRAEQRAEQQANEQAAQSAHKAANTDAAEPLTSAAASPSSRQKSAPKAPSSAEPNAPLLGQTEPVAALLSTPLLPATLLPATSSALAQRQDRPEPSAASQALIEQTSASSGAVLDARLRASASALGHTGLRGDAPHPMALADSADAADVANAATQTSAAAKSSSPYGLAAKPPSGADALIGEPQNQADKLRLAEPFSALLNAPNNAPNNPPSAAQISQQNLAPSALDVGLLSATDLAAAASNQLQISAVNRAENSSANSSANSTANSTANGANLAPNLAVTAAATSAANQPSQADLAQADLRLQAWQNQLASWDSPAVAMAASPAPFTAKALPLGAARSAASATELRGQPASAAALPAAASSQSSSESSAESLEASRLDSRLALDNPPSSGFSHSLNSAQNSAEQTLIGAAGPAPAWTPASLETQGGVSARGLSLTPEVGSNQWGQALGQQLRHLSTLGQQSASLALNPPGLGPLNISLSLHEQQLQVVFVSAHLSVRSALEAALPELRASLADSGISLGQTSVNSGGGQSASYRQAQSQTGYASGESPSTSGLRGAAANPSDSPAVARNPRGASLDTYA